ncbi:MmgE/PrpD family protein [Microbispora sp. NPDC049125]|uniref:MmgE/PrpD family protein n=1 Tax=Microbispora sp. NPDC049125 TaxID=3154929 RepID=UPI0034672931
MTLLEELTGWAAKLTLDQVPPRVVEMAKSQVLSQLAAIRGGMAHPQGQTLLRAFGTPLQPTAKKAATVLAGLTSWLHLDDTAYAGHLSNSTVSVPFAYAEACRLDGTALLTAIIAANECAARITASATLGPFRGQMAAHTHLAGAIAARLHASGAPAGRWVDAFGLAFAMPIWTLTHGFMGSEARMLSSALPVRVGLAAVDSAAGGLSGAPDILEHPKGFLATFAQVPVPTAITVGLGDRWHTETLSFKVHPSGPGTDTAVDCALRLHAELDPDEMEAIEEIVVRASLYTLMVDKAAAEYLDGPRTPVSALVSATPYAVATALSTGGLTPADFTAPATDDPARWALAAKVRLVHDKEMTTILLHADAPFGEAIRAAGERGAAWVRDFGGPLLADLLGPIGPPRASFEDAVKATPAAVSVHLAGGRVVEHRADVPVGGIGPDTRASHRRLVRGKFLEAGGPAEVADAVNDLERLSASEIGWFLRTALQR